MKKVPLPVRCLCAILGLFWIMPGGRVPAADAQQAQRAAGEQLAKDLAAAAKSGAKEFTIPAGEYRYALNKEWTLTAWQGLKDLTIRAQGATFIFEAWKFGLLMKDCENVTLEGLNIEYDPLPYTQGVILAVHEERTLGKSWFEYQTAPGYLPLEEIDYDAVLKRKSEPLPAAFFSADGKDIKIARWGRPEGIERLSPGHYRIHLDAPSFIYPNPTAFTVYSDYGIAPGAQVAFMHRTSGSAILLYRCAGVTLRNVTVFSSPGGGFTDLGHHDKTGGQRFESCAVIRKPGTGRLFATNGDAFHSYLGHRGPTITGCRAEYIGDDFLNIRGTMSLVLTRENPQEIELCMRAPFETDSVLYPGTRLLFFDRTTGEPRGEARVKERKAVNRPELTALVEKSRTEIGVHGIDPKALYAVSLDNPVTAGTFDYILFPEDSCAGFRVENNTFRHGLARGTRLQTGNGVFAGNTIAQTQGTALSISMQCDWLEGGLCENLQITGNRFVDPESPLTDLLLRQRIACEAVPESKFAAILLMSETKLGRVAAMTYPHHTNLLFADNTIINSKGPGIYIANAKNITLRNNRVLYAPTIAPETKQELQASATVDMLGRGVPATAVNAQNNQVISEE